MSAFRIRLASLAAFAAVTVATMGSTALADIPVGPRPEPPPAAPADIEAPLKVIVSGDAGVQTTLVIPRRFVEQAGAAGGAAGSKPSRSKSLLAVLGTIAGGGALSLGVLTLGIYFIRRSHRRALRAVAGTVAAVAVVVGAGVVLANAPPPHDPVPFTRDAEAEMPNVKIVIVDEGDAIELTLPSSLVRPRS